MKTVTLDINQKTCVLEVRDSELLIETLRDRLGLLGTKYSCLEGDCGACTVLLDGNNVLSCLILTLEAEGRKITTIEGMSPGGELHPVQQAFIDAGAVQCGFCTPGMVLASKALLDKNSHPDKEDIVRALDGNLCRCTGYVRIVEAVTAAAKAMEKTS
ncbi:MAG: (2Fe-2S)-binding protein [Candidatus Omnitrophica bacterium]|nr:(2Fe-2S)-binding protein [Candidatus Omnitrophota bacterium]MDD5574454.1 (2Fe-2S)-binding protein [Candidatus Omnitrophota bacterium]